MREELLAHLTAAFDEEAARLGDDRAALGRTLRRFGDPADLTRELQAAVPWLERVLFARFWVHLVRHPRADEGRADGHRPGAAAGRGAAGWPSSPGLTFAMLVLLPLVEVAGGKDWSAAFVSRGTRWPC